MPKKITHSLILVLTIFFSYQLSKSSLADYDLQISAFLFLVLFVLKKFVIPQQPASKLLESVIFTFVVLSITNSTGGVSSSFFFLIYFLLFSLSLILEPFISATTTIALIILFLFSLPPNQPIQNLLPIFSLAFLTPFALFMGQVYIENQNSKIKSQNTQKDTFLFLSLMLKNNLKNIKMAVENFMGDREIDSIKKNTRKMEKLIDEFEKGQTVI